MTDDLRGTAAMTRRLTVRDDRHGGGVPAASTTDAADTPCATVSLREPNDTEPRPAGSVALALMLTGTVTALVGGAVFEPVTVALVGVAAMAGVAIAFDGGRPRALHDGAQERSAGRATDDD